MRRTLLALLILFFIPVTGCFDCEEVVVFENDLSGYVEYRYTVPLFPKTKRSIIKYFPVSKSRIFEKHQREVLDYSVEYFESEEKSSITQRLATVSYRVRFSRPKELETILIGKADVRTEKNLIVLNRKIPRDRLAEGGAERLAGRIRDISIQRLKEHKIRFRVLVPPFYAIHATRGVRLQMNEGYFEIPLEETIGKKEDFEWQVSITTSLFSPVPH